MFDPRDPGPLLGYALESFRYRREQRRGRAAR
jgi:hypothetical protein